MKPLSEIPREQLARVRGIAFDVDDTLTRDGTLVLAALKALYRAKAAGLMRIAVTGRPLGWADVLAQVLPLTFAVGENGAGYVHRRNGALERGYVDSEADREAQQARLTACLADVRKRFPNIPVTRDHPARRCDLAFDIRETVDTPQEQVDALRTFIASLGLGTSESSIHMHAVPAPWNKAEGLLAGHRAVCGKDMVPEEWIFVGDSPNDEAAFAHFPLSVGVANVRKTLPLMRSHPKFVTKASHGDGFAEVVACVLASTGPLPPAG